MLSTFKLIQSTHSYPEAIYKMAENCFFNPFHFEHSLSLFFLSYFCPSSELLHLIKYFLPELRYFTARPPPTSFLRQKPFGFLQYEKSVFFTMTIYYFITRLFRLKVLSNQINYLLFSRGNIVRWKENWVSEAVENWIFGHHSVSDMGLWRNYLTFLKSELQILKMRINPIMQDCSEVLQYLWEVVQPWVNIWFMIQLINKHLKRPSGDTGAFLL